MNLFFFCIALWENVSVSANWITDTDRMFFLTRVVQEQNLKIMY